MQDHLVIYVHVPFCSSKCHFCSWTSAIPASELVNKKAHSSDYKTAVVRQLKSFGAAVKSEASMRLIYFGGGTPSLLESRDLADILETIHAVFKSDGSFQDTTIEIAPETVDLDKLRDLRAAGFTRISFGFQSLNEQRVRQIARAHSTTQAVRAFEMARQAGFDNINIDLMLGFPDETDKEWNESLASALSLSPDHLSLYVYKMVPETVMARQIEQGITKATPTAVSIRRYLDASDRLAATGYHEYMFQLFARDGKHCFCDQSYFNQAADHVGFGAGAHSLLKGYVMGHSPDYSSYLRQPQFEYRFPIGDAPSIILTKLFEMLHTDRGIDRAQFERRMRISTDEAERRYSLIGTFFEDLARGGATDDAAGCISFRNKQERAAWLCRQPQRYDTSLVPAPADNIVNISAAAR
jgi:putative oxygen-independent coproporphyrinogen III oxidase